MKCCDCTYHIPGCYNSCDDIQLTLEGIEDGSYTINTGTYTFTATAEDGVLTIPANSLNESDCTTLQIVGYELTVDDTLYNCFKIVTVYQPTLDAVPTFNPQPPAPGIDTNFANTDLTFDADRVHDLDSFSLIIREPGIHSLQLGADAPAGMIPISGLKFSGFTGSNASDSLMSLIGNLKGIPNNQDVFLPFLAILRGDPFGAGGEVVSTLYSASETSPGVFELGIITGYDNTDDGVSVTKYFYDGNESLIDEITSEIKWQLRRDGSIRHDGVYANNGYVVYQGGGDDTIPDNTSFYVYDPASVQAGATITLPANPVDGQTLYIFGGGTITSGNVITSFTLDGNGRTIIGNGANQLKAGKAIEVHFMNNIWYAIDN